MTIKNLPKQSGIYCITCNNKNYVGSAINIYNRVSKHIATLRSNKHANIKMQSHFNKYTEDCFSVKVLELVENKENLIEREQYWIDELNSCSNNGLNLLPNAASNLGYKWSEEQRLKIKGRQTLSETEKSRRSEKMKDTGNPFYGKKHTGETREIIRQKNIEYNKLHGNSFQGKKHSLETKEKLRNYAINRTVEHRKKLGAHMTRTYLITFPDGHEETIHGLKQWCSDNQLKYDFFKDLKRGRIKNNLGWSIREIIDDNINSLVN